MKDGKKVGPWVFYHDNGQLNKQGVYKDGKVEGPWVSYHGNGQLDSKGTYKDGKREGFWVFYDKRGTKKFKEHVLFFDEETGTYKNGVKVK